MVIPDGAVLLGISGHQVASILGCTEIEPLGEQGPYTVVAYKGRNGFVLTESLMRREDLEAASNEAAGEFVAKLGSGHRLAARVLQIAACLVTTGVITAAIFAFISSPLAG